MLQRSAVVGPCLRLVCVLGVAALAACGGELTDDDRLAHDDELHPYFRRAYPDGQYVLTTFGGPDDSSAYGHRTACGPRVYGKKFYSTGVYGWGCNARARITANGKCAIVDVIDNGPAAWVETNAKNKCGVGRVLDVSPAVSRHLFGSGSYGWSQCRKVTVEHVSSASAPGPCSSSSWSPSGSGSGTGGTVAVKCSSGGRQGTCEDTGSASCSSGFKRGLCPGPNNIRCCLAPANVGGVDATCKVGTVAGTCKNTQTSSCSSGFKSGYCPGPSNVKCCLGTASGIVSGCKVGSQSGVCKSTQTDSCASGFKSGYCPGPNTTKCCLNPS